MIEESLQYQEVDLITRKSGQETYPYFNYRQRPFNHFHKKDKLMVWSNYIRGMKLTSLTIYNWIRFFLCCSFPNTLVLLYKLLKICLLFSMQLFLRAECLRRRHRYFKRLISFQNNWKTLNLLSFFLFRMYCVVTRSSLRLFSNHNFGKYVYVVDLLLQRITVGVLCSFSDLSFRIQLTKLPYSHNIYSPGS